MGATLPLMSQVTLSVDNFELHLMAPDAAIGERRPFTRVDLLRLRDLSERYELACDQRAYDQLKSIGDELGDWLGARGGWLDELLNQSGPLNLELSCDPEQRGPNQRALFGAPWELMRADDKFLAGSRLHRYSPVRRLAAPGQVAPRGARRGALCVLFMAASPQGGGPRLNAEQEENGIFETTRGLPLDMFVESTGCLDELAQQAALLHRDNRPLHVIHLSCHGESAPSPIVLLEKEDGSSDSVNPAHLLERLGPTGPELGLLFVSACKSATPGGSQRRLDSFALTLAAAGVPAVLGWGASVKDPSAIEFAALFYGQLARGDTSLEGAVAFARRALYESHKAESGYWHLSRLFLGPRGGGRVCEVAGQRRRLRDRTGDRLDARGQVPVAGRGSFVRRQTELRQGIRGLRSDQHIGVAVYGPPGCGKSSLAERLIDRMASTHVPVIVVKKLTGRHIVDAIASRLGNAANWRKRWLPRADEELAGALLELLNAPPPLPEDKALLLVLDAIESAPPTAISMVLQAFAATRTHARLLLTSIDLLTDDTHPAELISALAQIKLPRRWL